MSIVNANHYDGLNIDFESGAATDRDALSLFIQTLAADMHADGKKLSVCVAPTNYDQTTGRAGFYNYQALAANADYVFVMGWGLHWATSAPGSIDDINWERGIINYINTQPNKSKFVLGDRDVRHGLAGGRRQVSSGGCTRVLVRDGPRQALRSHSRRGMRRRSRRTSPTPMAA